MATVVEPVVSAVGLTKEFRDFWCRPKARAVNDIDFEIRPGEVVGLLGPNGSGKSTTVKLILGLLYPTGGRVTVFGRSPRAVETKREIGYLPEESYLYKYLTAEETLDFFGSLFNLSAADRKQRIGQLLDMVGLAHARHRRVGEFSKGMARRIGLAQAMINDPAFLILDEPTSGLDPLGCKEVKDLILTLKRRGKTVLITSHLLSDIEDVCDRVIILYGGRVRAEGSLDKLLTVSGENRIVTPELPSDAMRRLIELLRGALDGDHFRIDHPRRTLEEFFLDVIATAKRDSVETSGASGNGAIAPYLRDGGSDDKSGLLETLTAETPAAPAVEPVAATAALRGGDAAAEAAALAAALAEPNSENEPDSAGAPVDSATADPVALDNANAKLKSLLGESDERK